MSRVCAVVNPHSAGGGTGRRLAEVRVALERHFTEVQIRCTTGPGDGVAQARAARADGHDFVLAVGGDGTVHEVVNGLLLEPGVPTFGVLHAGTGGDFVKTLGVPRCIEDAVVRLANAKPRPCDVMRCGFVDHDGQPAERYCINVLGFGLNGEVVRAANASKKRFGGRITFAMATLRSLAHYQPAPVVVCWTDKDGVAGSWRGALSSAFVANGAHCGGGMTVGTGVLDDGVVDLSLIPDLPLHKTILATPHLYDGSLRDVKEVSTAEIVALEARCENGQIVRIDLDGEQPGRLPLTATVIAKALLVRA